MTWDYRIVRYHNGSGFGLHEVYYGEAGEPIRMTAEPAGFVADAEEGPGAIIRALQRALKGAGPPVFDEPAEWAANGTEIAAGD